MTSLRRMKEREYIPQRTYVKLMILGTLSLSKVLITNLGDLKKVRKLTPSNRKYVRPSRRYELPEYKSSMKCYAKEDTKYLRKTLYVNPCANEIVAMAHELGAGEKNPHDFANDAFEFVKRNVTLEYLEMDDAVATLKRGTGTCLHMLNLYVALCRAAGIKARYKLYALQMIQEWYNAIVVDPLLEKWYNAMGYFMVHGEGEVLIDEKWYPADVAPTPERQAAAGIPITKFGEDSIGVWFFAIPGTIMRMESLPYGLGLSMKLLKKIAPGTVDKLNASVIEQIEKGKKIFEEIGEEKYDRNVRKKSRPGRPEPILNKVDKIVFEE